MWTIRLVVQAGKRDKCFRAERGILEGKEVLCNAASPDEFRNVPGVVGFRLGAKGVGSLW